MGDFKLLKTQLFNNVKIKGFFEHKVTPIEFFFNVSFSILPTPKARKLSVVEFTKCAKDNLSCRSIDCLCSQAVNTGKIKLPKQWKYDGSRYTFDHSIDSLKPTTQNSSFGIDMIFCIYTNDINSIKENYTILSKNISYLPSFQSSKYFIFRAMR